jgi:hypothetical protein
MLLPWPLYHYELVWALINTWYENSLNSNWPSCVTVIGHLAINCIEYSLSLKKTSVDIASGDTISKKFAKNSTVGTCSHTKDSITGHSDIWWYYVTVCRQLAVLTGP